MPSAPQLDKKLLKTLEPLSGLSNDALDELASKSKLETMAANRIIFRQGDSDNRMIFLLNGKVDLTNQNDKTSHIVKGNSRETRKPLSNDIPRQVTAITKSEVSLLVIDTDLLEVLMGDTMEDNIEVTDLSGEADSSGWMLRFLQSPTFLHLPTENIQKLLMSMEEVAFKKGDKVINQGDENNFYYIVQQGECSVSRRPAPNAEDIRLAILHNGDGFGEEALITGGKRNASVTMLEDGQLMRLSKDDFLQLLVEPLIDLYNENQVRQNLARGSLVIDVRNHENFINNHIEGSINIPLSMLRTKISGLNPERDYIIVCEDGTYSKAAAFLLIQQGLTCHILQNGLKSASITLKQNNKVTPQQAETAKTRQADEDKIVAEAKANKIKQQAAQAKARADELARKTREAETARVNAQKELKRLKQQEQAQQDNALQSAQKQIEREAQRAKQAEEAYRKLKAEQDKNSEHQQALKKALQQAEKIALESDRIAAEAHKQAERDAERIRKQAEKEAQKLRQEMEAERKRFEDAANRAREDEERQKQQAIEEARAKARQAVKQASEQAKVEAERIRMEALQEAESLRSQMEQTREQLEKNINDAKTSGEIQRQALLEEARREAEKVAQTTTHQAELEAEQIRRKALEEAERLREEMQAAKQQIEEQAALARQQLEQKQRAKQAAKEKAEAEQAARKAKLLAVEKEKQKQQQAREEALKREQARKRAEAIKARLEKMAKQKQQTHFDQQIPQSGGMALGNFVVKESSDGRIILDGEEDIFMFKPPQVSHVNKSKMLEEAEAAEHEVFEELPSFDVDESDNEETVPVPAQFNNTADVVALTDHSSNMTTQEASHGKSPMAIAAALILALGVGALAYVKFVNPDLADQFASSPKNNKATANIMPGKKSTKKSDIKAEERKQKQNAESEFESLMEKWKKTVYRSGK